MRLLNVHSTKLETFYNEQIPNFAILSHTWLSDDQEVTFARDQTTFIPWDRIRYCMGIANLGHLLDRRRGALKAPQVRIHVVELDHTEYLNIKGREKRSP